MRVTRQPFRVTRLGDLAMPDYIRCGDNELDRDDPRGQKVATIEAKIREHWGDPFDVPGLGQCWRGKTVTHVNGKRREALVVVDAEEKGWLVTMDRKRVIQRYKGAVGGPR